MDELSVLVNRARSADLEAFGELVRRFQDMAYGCAYAILGDFHLAEDAAQEAFLEAYRSLSKLTRPKAFPGWLRRIVLRRCSRITRRKSLSTAPIEAARNIPDGGPGPSSVAEKMEMKDKVLAAIKALPDSFEDYRAKGYLYAYFGMPKEAAQQFYLAFKACPDASVPAAAHELVLVGMKAYTASFFGLEQIFEYISYGPKGKSGKENIPDPFKGL